MATGLAVLLAACAASPSSVGSQGASPTAGGSTSPSDERPHPPQCLEATLAFDPATEAMLLANCIDQSDLDSLEQVWSWDGTAWTQLDAHGPPAMVVTGVAYDTERRVVVRYGGLPMRSNTCQPETWEWDGAEWSETSADPPTACDHIFLAYEAARQRTLLFGGGDDSGNLIEETWAWDGMRWRLLSDSGPPGRAHFGFVYDDSHGQTLLYGGYDGSQVFSDFWTWDGSAWHQDALEEPGPRSHLGMAVRPDGMLLFGGATNASTFTSLTDETWYLHRRWTRVEGPGPSARGSPALGYDSVRDVFVLYGGFDSSGAALGDTWEWDGSWRCVDGCS